MPRSARATPRGTNVARVVNFLDELRRAEQLGAYLESVAQVAFTTAATLDKPFDDDSPAGRRATALLTAQLRSALRELHHGTNTFRVVELIDSLRREKPLDTHSETVGQLALTLAGQLDDPDISGRDAAAVAREYRPALDELVKGSGGSDDDEDWTAGLSAAVRDTPEP